MPTFTYQARDAKGERVSGSHEAADQRAALEALRATGLFVTKLEAGKSGAESTPAANEGAIPSAKEAPNGEQSTPKARPPATGDAQPRVPAVMTAAPPLPPRYWLRANLKELALFFRQMNSMLHAGVSIAHALNTMATNAPSKGLRAACAEMAPRIAAGQPFSDLMKSYPGIFTPLMAGMIRAGEMGGFLDRMCLRLSQYAERDYEIQQTIKRETWYPKLVLGVALLLPTIIPAAQAYFLGTGNFWQIWIRAAALPIALLVAYTLIVRFKSYLTPLTKHISPLVYVLDQIKLLIPIAGKTARSLATAKFCRSLGTLQAAGMGMQQIIHLSADACGNAVIAEKSRKTIRLLESGSSLTDALQSTGQFPGIAIQMLRTGEETGNMDEQLDKVADFLEGDAETTIKQSVAVLGIVIFLLMAVYVGYQVIQQYAGTYGGMMDEAENLAN